VEFLAALEQNPGRWAQYPVERKTKPELPEGFKTARRDGVLYAQFAGGEQVTEQELENAAEDEIEAEQAEYETVNV
jgi:hypothetical protein